MAHVSRRNEVFTKFKKYTGEVQGYSEDFWKNSRSAAIVTTEHKLDFSHHAGQRQFTKRNKKGKKRLKEMYVK